MDGIVKFLEMGGYGYYVWPAIGVTLLVMAMLWILSVRTLRTREVELRLLEASDPARREEGAADET